MIKKTALQAIHIAKLIYTPLSFIFILYFSWLNRELLYKMVVISDLGFILLAILSWCILHLISPFLTKNILTILNCRIAYPRLLHIYISRLPARYIPGGIWHTVGRFADYHLHGISKKQLATLAAIETVLPALITFLLGGGYLWASGTTSLANSIEGILAITSFFMLLSGPFLIKLWKEDHLGEKYISYYFLFIFVSVIFWAIASISFIFYYLSLTLHLPEIPLLDIASTYVFSWGVGYISIFAPQGIGIFELVAGKLMALPMNLGGAIAFIAGFRVVVLFADCLTWATYKLSQQFIFKSHNLPSGKSNKTI